MNTFPHLHLLVSGGNSQIIWVQNWQKWQIVGQTLDDAAGECLDKIGRMLGLDYPGGIWVARIAGVVENNDLKFPIGLSQQFAKSSNSFNQNQNQETKLELAQKPIDKVKIGKTRPQNSFLRVADQNLITKKITSQALNHPELPSELSEKFSSSIPKTEINLSREPQLIGDILEFRSNYHPNFQPNSATNWNYSFSGLKTAVRYFLQKQTIPNWTLEQKLSLLEVQILLNWPVLQDFMKNFKAADSKSKQISNPTEPDLALTPSNQLIDTLIPKWQALGLISTNSQSEFFQTIQSQDLIKLKLFYQVCLCAQTAVMTQLTGRLEMAIGQLKPASLGLSGGVSANLLLRAKMQELTKKHKLSKLYLPPLALTGDNAVMIGLAGLADIWSERSGNN